MGGGFYSSDSHTLRATSKGYATKSTLEIFQKRSIDNAMSPKGVKIRESRDSAEHPNSLAIILGLDTTGSMGNIPHELIKSGLPTIMDALFKGGVSDPQVLFAGVGDHKCDEAPLQVSQFESSDELLDKWLTNVYLEGHGGGNGGESYSLVWYFAVKHTSIDCLEKRGQKGFLFTIGDEPVHPSISETSLKQLMGEGEFKTYTSEELLAMACEKYNVFHIHLTETASGTMREVVAGWKTLMGERLIIAERHQDIPRLISEAITRSKTVAHTNQTARVPVTENML